MNCLEFQIQLDDAVENRRELPFAVCQHAETCTEAPCQAAWADYHLLSEAVAQWKRGTHSVDLVDRVMTDAVRDAFSVVPQPAGKVAGTGQKPRRRWWQSSTVVACAIALIAGGVSLMRNSGVEHIAAYPAAESDSDVDGDTAGYQELGSLYVGWIEGASSGMAGSVTSVLMPTVHPGQTEAPRTSNSWLEMWGEQFRPLEEELGRTIQVFAGEEQEDRTQIPSPEIGNVS